MNSSMTRWRKTRERVSSGLSLAILHVASNRSAYFPRSRTDDCAASDLIETRSRALESHVWEQNPPPGGTANYRNKMRSFYLNLKAANNPGLREDVVSGEISIVQLYEMDPKVSLPGEGGHRDASEC